MYTFVMLFHPASYFLKCKLHEHLQIFLSQISFLIQRESLNNFVKYLYIFLKPSLPYHLLQIAKHERYDLLATKIQLCAKKLLFSFPNEQRLPIDLPLKANLSRILSIAKTYNKSLFQK